MGRHSLLLVDAFTETPFTGNACAVVFDADGLDDATMQAIAREMNLSETAFVLRSTVADVRARYLTPAEEIPLAGHPTIATIFALVETGRLKAGEGRTTVSLELKHGPIGVAVDVREGRVNRITMSQRRPEFLRTYPAEEVLPVFRLSPSDLVPGLPVQTVDTGTPQLMVPLRDHDALRRAAPDISAYRRLRAEGDFFSPHLFALQGVSPDAQTFARHFGVPPDTLEDPFTGSATGNMGAYLWRYDLIEGPSFIAEQGHWMQRPGRGYVEVVGPRQAIETVRVGGSAVVVMRGELAG